MPFPDHASADVVLEKIDAVGGDLNALERLIYRYVVINRVRDGLVEPTRNSPQDSAPGLGPTEVDRLLRDPIRKKQLRSELGTSLSRRLEDRAR